MNLVNQKYKSINVKSITIKIAITFFSIIIFSCNSDSGSQDLINAVDTEFYEDGDFEIVFENDLENGINIIFMGDAYTEVDLGKNYGKYRQQALANINALFQAPPFSEYKEHFNAYIVYVKSNNNMISIENGAQTDTAFGTQSYINNLTTLTALEITNYENLQFYSSIAMDNNLSNNKLILMSVNNTGRGTAILGGDLALFGNGNIYTMIHEVGHAFAGLGDEYILEGSFQYNTESLPNLDNTEDLNIVKWSHFIGLEDYSMVNAFEGGGYNEIGIWRPEFASIMGTTGPNLYFNAPSRETIVKRIMDIKGIEYSFDDFLEIDQLSLDAINSD